MSSGTVMIVVLSGASWIVRGGDAEGVVEPGVSYWTPQPARASQLRMASGSQPRRWYKCKNYNYYAFEWEGYKTDHVIDDLNVPIPL